MSRTDEAKCVTLYICKSIYACFDYTMNQINQIIHDIQTFDRSIFFFKLNKQPPVEGYPPVSHLRESDGGSVYNFKCLWCRNLIKKNNGFKNYINRKVEINHSLIKR